MPAKWDLCASARIRLEGVSDPVEAERRRRELEHRLAQLVESSGRTTEVRVVIRPEFTFEELQAYVKETARSK